MNDSVNTHRTNLSYVVRRFNSLRESFCQTPPFLPTLGLNAIRSLHPCFELYMCQIPAVHAKDQGHRSFTLYVQRTYKLILHRFGETLVHPSRVDNAHVHAVVRSHRDVQLLSLLHIQTEGLDVVVSAVDVDIEFTDGQ